MKQPISLIVFGTVGFCCVNCEVLIACTNMYVYCKYMLVQVGNVCIV